MLSATGRFPRCSKDSTRKAERARGDFYLLERTVCDPVVLDRDILLSPLQVRRKPISGHLRHHLPSPILFENFRETGRRNEIYMQAAFHFVSVKTGLGKPALLIELMTQR